MSAADVITTALAALREERARIDQAIAALESLATGGRVPAMKPDKPASKIPATAPAATAQPGQKPGHGKLAAAEPRIRELLAAGMSAEAVGQKVGCTGQAVRMLARKRGWKRGAAPAPANGASAGPAPKVTVLPRGVSRRAADD